MERENKNSEFDGIILGYPRKETLNEALNKGEVVLEIFASFCTDHKFILFMKTLKATLLRAVNL